MATISSLLKQAESARKKRRQFEDQLAAYEWSISAKTQDDFLEYSKFIGDRLVNENDASKALSYQKTLTSTRRSFVSHEIQRQSINVLEGRQNSQGKYNTMVDLYQSAVELGDLDLAQSLRLQLDNLDRSIQAEQQRANSIASTMASAQATSVEDTVDYITKDTDPNGAFNFIDEEGNNRVLPTLGALRKIYEDGGEESINEISQLVADATGTGAGNYWDIAGAVVEQVIALNQEGAQLVGVDTSKGRQFLQFAERIQNGEMKFEIAPGLGKLSYTDVIDAQDASRAGQQLFIPAQRNGENVFEKTKVTDFVWGRDANGDYKLIQVRQEFGDNFGERGQQIKFTNADGETEFINPTDARNRLIEQGFNISESDGKLVLGTTQGQSQARQLQALGISPGTSFDVVTGRDGNLRFVTPDERIFDIELNESGFGLTEVKKEDVSVFGEFGLGQFGAPTREGVEIVKRITRQDQKATQSDLLQRSFSHLQDTSNILSTAQLTSERLRLAEEERQRAAELVQPSSRFAFQQAGAPGLNTTGVPDNSRLSVQPVPLPSSNLTVQPTRLPTSNLRVTPTQPSTNDLKVTDIPKQPKLRVDNTRRTGSLRVR